jgi:hypothetical protein
MAEVTSSGKPKARLVITHVSRNAMKHRMHEFEVLDDDGAQGCKVLRNVRRRPRATQAPGIMQCDRFAREHPIVARCGDDLFRKPIG